MKNQLIKFIFLTGLFIFTPHCSSEKADNESYQNEEPAGQVEPAGEVENIGEEENSAEVEPEGEVENQEDLK